MRAVVMTGLGPAKQTLKVVADHAKPVRKPGEVLIEVHATSINPGEWHVREGMLPKAMIRTPQILGCDVAGVVLEADAGSKFKPGDRVVGDTGQILTDPWGTYAEFVSAKASRLTPIPDGVTFEQAAALPIAGMTAWQALAPSMPLRGKRVLVLGGSGGVGHLAVQIAKSQGAFVAATCSARNAQFVTETLGADLALDYTQGPITPAAAGDPYDVIADLVGSEPSSWGLLKRGGRLAAVSFDAVLGSRRGFSAVASLLAHVLAVKTRSALGLTPGRYDMVAQSGNPDEGLSQLVQLVAEGKVRAHVDRVISLEQIPQTHEYAEQSRTRGKIVVRVKEA